MSKFLDESQRASEVGVQAQVNKSTTKVFAGRVINFMDNLKIKNQVIDLRRFYPREYIDGILSQINFH